jgi:hypothetical protein
MYIKNMVLKRMIEERLILSKGFMKILFWYYKGTNYLIQSLSKTIQLVSFKASLF